MDNLTQLAKQYKSTKDPNISNQIFKLLDNAIKQKASYVFYKQKFIKDRNKVHEMEIFDKESKSFKSKLVPSCFRLCDTKKIDLEDIIQECNLFILELLEKYNPKKPFENYLFSSLKDWRPECIRNYNFMQDVDTINESNLPKLENTNLTLDNMLLKEADKTEEELQEENIEMEDLFKKLTKKERNFLKTKKEYPDANQSQIAKIIGVTPQNISLILKSLKKKLVK